MRRPGWPRGAGAPLVSPIQPSAVYRAADPDALDAIYEGRAEGYTYAREGHPNADVLAGMIDDLEGRPGGLVTGSGMAALGAPLLAILRAGDHVIGGDQLYGRSLRMLTEDLPRMGVDVSLVDTTDAAAVAAAVRPETKAILAEVVSNPTLRISDIDGIADISKACGATFILDNTFTTPRGFAAWDAGADVVIHSVTKLLAGHSDVTLGYVAARDPGLATAIKVAATTWGFTPSAFDCWLAERGLLTFDLRFERATANATALAAALSGLDGVEAVIYPGRSDHPDAVRAGRLKSPGNMLSLRLKGGRDAAVAFTRAASALPFAPTLGDVSTTISHPASSSHRALSTEARASVGITEGFFRLSVGVEEPEFLIDTLTGAVTAARG